MIGTGILVSGFRGLIGDASSAIIPLLLSAVGFMVSLDLAIVAYEPFAWFLEAILSVHIGPHMRGVNPYGTVGVSFFCGRVMG